MILGNYLTSMVLSFLIHQMRDSGPSLAAVAQWIECQPVNQKITGLIASQGTCLACGLGPQLGACERQPHTDISLPLSFPSPPSLKINTITLKKNKTPLKTVHTCQKNFFKADLDTFAEY